MNYDTRFVYSNTHILENGYFLRKCTYRGKLLSKTILTTLGQDTKLFQESWNQLDLQQKLKNQIAIWKKFICRDELELLNLWYSLGMILYTNVGSNALKVKASFSPTASATRIRGTTPWRDSTRCNRGNGCFCRNYIGLILGLDRIPLVSYSFVAKPIGDLMW